MAKKKSAYARAGVDIDEMMSGLARIKKSVRSTRTAGCAGQLGSFGGLFRSPGRDHLLVASTDGVGTKLKVAVMAGEHRSVGRDLVNHCVNDILAQGARPLFFLDYLGTSRLSAAILADIVSGLARACRENGMALLGGETAEMPGLYPPDEYDLVGTIVGSVPRRDLITGERIRPGDVLLGLPSSGLHTNGYSLARRVLFDQAGLGINDPLPGMRRTVARALLAVHRSYLKPVDALRRKVRITGMAHITGGGFVDNIPRILPDGVDALVRCDAWRVPAVFRILRDLGGIDPAEMYRVFNMGIGMVVMVRGRDEQTAVSALAGAGTRARVIGTVVKGAGTVRLER